MPHRYQTLPLDTVFERPQRFLVQFQVVLTGILSNRGYYRYSPSSVLA